VAPVLSRGIRHATMALTQAMLLMSGAVALRCARGEPGIRRVVGSGLASMGGGLLTAVIVIAMLVRHWESDIRVCAFSVFGLRAPIGLTGARGMVVFRWVTAAVSHFSCWGPIRCAQSESSLGLAW